MRALCSAKTCLPEFTVKLEEYPCDVPPTYKIDQCIEENLAATQGYRIDNRSIEVTIKNQPFSYSFNNTQYYLGYTVCVKGHFGDAWTIFSDMLQSNSEYTVIYKSIDYPSGTQLDFQVNAYIGTIIKLRFKNTPFSTQLATGTTRHNLPLT